MAITVGGKPLNLDKGVSNVSVSEPKLPSQKRTLVHKNVIDKSHEQPLLVVNGKVKKINKNSSYLIDMLVIDEE